MHAPNEKRASRPDHLGLVTAIIRGRSAGPCGRCPRRFEAGLEQSQYYGSDHWLNEGANLVAINLNGIAGRMAGHASFASFRHIRSPFDLVTLNITINLETAENRCGILFSISPIGVTRIHMMRRLWLCLFPNSTRRPMWTFRMNIMQGKRFAAKPTIPLNPMPRGCRVTSV